MQDTGNSMVQVEIQQCIQDCLDCHKACMDKVESYRQAGNDQTRMQYMTLLLDCAEMCLTSAHFMQHNTPLYGYVCQACAQVCTHCGGESELQGDTDTANACRKSAWSCEQMAKILP